MSEDGGARLQSVIYKTPTVTSLGGRDGSVRSADGLLELQVALPRELGGPGDRTNPEELFAAGYAACFHSAVKSVAAQKKLQIGTSTIEARISLGPLRGDTAFGLAAELHVTLPAATLEAAREVVREAHRICPYSNATRGNIDVTLTVTAADGSVQDVP